MAQGSLPSKRRPVREIFQRWANGESKVPIAEFIGFRPVSFRSGEVVLEFDADERHHHPLGGVHGGILCNVADAAMGSAFASTLEGTERHATLELKMNFLRPVRKGRLKFLGRVVTRGRTIGLTECDVLDEAGKLVAKASSTLMILQGERGADHRS